MGGVSAKLTVYNANPDAYKKSFVQENKSILTLVMLIAFALILITVVFAERIHNTSNENYKMDPTFNLGMNLVILLIFFPMFVYTITEAFGKGGEQTKGIAYHLYGATASRNFFTVIAFMIFIMFVYENPEYGNNEKNMFLGKLGISNRVIGLVVLLGLSLYYAISVYMTTSEPPV